MVSCRCRHSPSFEPLQDFASCFPRAPMRRAAHNSIFFLFPAFAPEASLPRGFSSSLPAPRVLGHTVKELPSRGLKSRSGASHRDRQPVSRPPTDVTAREARSRPPRPSTHFEKKIQIFPRGITTRLQPSIPQWLPRVLRRQAGLASAAEWCLKFSPRVFDLGKPGLKVDAACHVRSRSG
jgi:hypothetical protein